MAHATLQRRARRATADQATREQPSEAHLRAGTADPLAHRRRRDAVRAVPRVRTEQRLYVDARARQDLPRSQRTDRVARILRGARPRRPADLRSRAPPRTRRAPVRSQGSRLWMPDSKTETGIRHVEITPALRDELLAHRAEKVRRGYPTTPDAPVFCTAKGTAWNEDNVRQQLLAPVVALASRRLVERGLPPLPRITPNSLRRTSCRSCCSPRNSIFASCRARSGTPARR